MVTDHKPNTFLTTKPAPQLTRRQVAWQATLSRFDFEWEYRKRAYNIADPLSGNPALLMHVAKNIFSQSSIQFMTKVRNGYSLDKWFGSMDNTKDLTQTDGLWKKDHQIVVPNVDSLGIDALLCIMTLPMLVT